MGLPLAIALGAMVGALARHYLSSLVAGLAGHGFPWGTLCVNIVGAFLLGTLVSWFALRQGVSLEVRGFLVVGLLGSFTTFSAFSLETLLLIERGAYLTAGGYILTSVFLTIGGLALGAQLMKTVTGLT